MNFVQILCSCPPLKFLTSIRFVEAEVEGFEDVFAAATEELATKTDINAKQEMPW
jgi:hypothetical protein